MLDERALTDALAGLPPLLPGETGDLPASLTTAQRRYGGAAFVVPARVMRAIIERIAELQNLAAQSAITEITADDLAMIEAEREALGGWGEASQTGETRPGTEPLYAAAYERTVRDGGS